MNNEKLLRDKDKAPPAKQPTLKKGQQQEKSRNAHDMPGADGKQTAGAEEDTYD